MIKKISAIAAAAIMAATMSVTAFATGYEDAVNAAKAAGVQANNVQELDNFLQAHKDCFTSAQYDEMIKTLNDVRDKYVAPYCKGGDKQLFDKTPAELTEDEKVAIGKKWTDDDRKAISDTLINLGKKYDVTVTVKQADDKIHYIVGAEHKHKDSSSSSKAGGTQTKTDNPVAATGAEESTSNAAAAVAAVTLALAGFGVAVVAKKNRA
ncbi:hypothetical protein [Ruminococcus sp.]|uniref:hypothetical protein n=1 Tax=Ruminococcus sp. TaxID=41978 RepID=UPI0025D6D056|nr:hypothetical protein [Ruminococcus sp.]MBQ8965926.1 hypothetical protein [Ruminococcus sp.]